MQYYNIINYYTNIYEYIFYIGIWNIFNFLSTTFPGVIKGRYAINRLSTTSRFHGHRVSTETTFYD